MKKKKRLFFWIVLTLILAFFIFKEVKDTLQGEKLFFLGRWKYSNKAYAKYLEIKPYVLNQEQLAYMMNHPDEEITQPTEKELYRKNVFIIFRMKNHGNVEAFGRLSYKFDCSIWFRTDVEIPPLTPKRNQYYDVVIPFGTLLLSNKDRLPPPVQHKWETLYAIP